MMKFVSDIKSVKSYWANVNFGGTAYKWEQVWLNFLLEPARQAGNLLEIGAGDGRMIKHLRNEGVMGDFHAVDITERVYGLKSNGILVTIGDTRKLPYKNESFDVVFSLGVVEHFRETSEAIHEHARITKLGGIVCITTPRLSPFTILRLMSFFVLRRKYRYGSFEAVEGRNLRLSEVKRDFILSGLDIIRSGGTAFYTPLGYRTFPLSRLDNILGGFLYCIGKKT